MNWNENMGMLFPDITCTVEKSLKKNMEYGVYDLVEADLVQMVTVYKRDGRMEISGEVQLRDIDRDVLKRFLQAHVDLFLKREILSNSKGRTVGVVIVATDITENQLLSFEVEQLRQYGLLGEISLGLAHDIKNPLTALLSSGYRRRPCRRCRICPILIAKGMPTQSGGLRSR